MLYRKSKEHETYRKDIFDSTNKSNIIFDEFREVVKVSSGLLVVDFL